MRNKTISMSVVWRLPNSPKKIEAKYIFDIPKGVTASYYLWIATGMRMNYKTQCFLNRIRGFQENIFKNFVDNN